MDKQLKFGIYTSFYNVENYVDRIFNNIESINYTNFEWHITDDFSTDNTKNLVLGRINSSKIKDKIVYVEQSHKQEMYWKPNIFFDKTFDWIVLIDSDDLVDVECLNVYNNLLFDNTDVVIVSSDFHKILESNDSLHSISYVLNKDKMSLKINDYHPKCDYLNNISYSCFGHLRAFKNNIINSFEIVNNLAGAEDSYRIFWLNSFGKYLNIPRPLYKWYLRENSISHNPNVSSSYNDNFEISLSKLQNSDFGVDTLFNDVYIETSALGSYEIGKLKNKNVTLWSKKLSESEKKKIKKLYPDVNLFFNEKNSTTNIICLNFFDKKGLDNLINELPKTDILLYYQNQKLHNTNEEKDSELQYQLQYFKKVLDNKITYSWWTYIRHFIIKT